MQWFDFLCENNIPFVIRAKENLKFRFEDGCLWSLRTALRGVRARHKIYTLRLWSAETGTPVQAAIKHLKSDEGLIVLTNQPNPTKALKAYRKPWAIEGLFGDAKTRGRNLEDTRLTQHGKVSTLMGVLALAMTWAARCGSLLLDKKTSREKHTEDGKVLVQTGARHPPIRPLRR
jgi:hypothetical protein